MTNHKPLAETIKEELQKTGYPTEIVSASIIKQRGWHILHNPSYLDDTDNKNREFDVWAVRTMPIDISSRNLLVSVCLIIECKKSENKPWIFFTTPEDYDAHILGRVIKWSLEGEQVFTSHAMLTDESNKQSIISDNNLREFHHYFQKPRLARTFHQACRGDKDHSPTIYGAVMSAIKATLFHNHDERKENWLRIYYPVIIFSGDLFEAQVDAKKEITLLRADHIQLSFNYKRPPAFITMANQSVWLNYHEFIVDIVRENYLDNFLQMIENEHEELLRHYLISYES